MRFLAPFAIAVLGSVLCTAPGRAQQPQPPQPALPLPPNIVTPLFQSGDVRQAIVLKDDQLRVLNELHARAREELQKQLEDLNAVKDPKERAARTLELYRDFDGLFLQTARPVFSPEQLTRYRQLQLQQQRFSAFLNPNLRQELKLTESQLQQLRLIGDLYDRDLALILRNAALNRQKAALQYELLQREANRQLNDLLTQEQRAAWMEMAGEPFVFAPPLPEPKP